MDYLRILKQLTVIINDISLSIIATWLAMSLRLEIIYFPELDDIKFFLIPIVFFLPIYMYAGNYLSVFRYFGIDNIKLIFFNTLIYGIILASVTIFLRIENIPRSIGIIQPIIFFLLILLSRITAAALLSRITSNKQLKKILIYGAGTLGFHASNEILTSNLYDLVGFIDDDKRKRGKKIVGKSIFHISEIESLIKKKSITDILITIPNISNLERKKLFAIASNYNVSVNIVPSIKNLLDDKEQFSYTLDITALDILNRNISIDSKAIEENIRKKVVLITGAGGSIGSELCKQICSFQPKKIVLLDHSEINLYSIDQAIADYINKKDFRIKKVTVLASIRDFTRLQKIMMTQKPDIVYHAAAYKHVPIVENNIIDSVTNNFIGTINTVQSAYKSKVSQFILISTDKAVRPTNIMGASKRLSEMYLQSFSRHIREKSDLVLSMVRFGNVLDSSGSVIPLFRKQIKEGGPITVTDMNVTRYFMTIPEAIGLILQSNIIAKGGEVFVLNMGKPVKILDLAKKMIKLSGLKEKNTENKEGDIEIIFTGLRPGEKLYEEMFINQDIKMSKHKEILYADEHHPDYEEMLSIKKQINYFIDQNDEKSIIKILKKEIQGFDYNII